MSTFNHKCYRFNFLFPEKCNPGEFSKTGLEPCHLCPKSFYQSNKKSTACISCSFGKTTTYPGATNSFNCSSTILCQIISLHQCPLLILRFNPLKLSCGILTFFLNMKAMQYFECSFFPQILIYNLR